MSAADKIILNQWGATNASKKFADSLLSALNDDIDRDASNPYVTDYYQTGDDQMDEGMSKRRGMVIETKDKFIVELRDFRGYDVGIWQEDERDVLMQIYPPGGRAMFPYIQCFKEALDEAFGRVYEEICPAQLEGYEHVEGHSQYLVHAPQRKGIDMVKIRLIGLHSFPESIWMSAVIDSLKLLSQLLVRHIERHLAEQS